MRSLFISVYASHIQLSFAIEVCPRATEVRLRSPRADESLGENFLDVGAAKWSAP
jgi:hypothetical protein